MELSSGDQSIVNEDRISQLPEALILQILSFLPTKIVVSTSVLSRQWRSRWKTVPSLEFNNYDDDHKISENPKFSEIVCKTFLSHKAPVLESLRLKFKVNRVNPVDIGLWVGIAFGRHLRELVIEVFDGACVIPSYFVNIPTPVLMKSLRTLHLIWVTYKDDESICNLLSGCPILEELVVKRRDIDDDFVTFTIEVPSLKRLTIYDDDYMGEWTRPYVINAPSLKYLTVQDLNGIKLSLNAPELLEAYFIRGWYTITENFLGSLKSAERLSMNLSSFQIPYRSSSIFYQLIYLEIYTNQEEWPNLLRVMLDSSPKLQVLNLFDDNNYDEESLVRRRWRRWKKPEHVPECLLSHLETFVWTNYNCEREEEREVASYILKNAKCLKNATFSINHLWKDEKKVSERRKMLNDELATVTMALESCQLGLKIE